MLRVRRHLTLIGACAVVAAAVGPGAATAAGRVVYVSNTAPVSATGGDCEHPQFVRIQSAVETVAPGSSIKVCPGSYAEQLVIEKGVKIINAAAAGEAVLTMPAEVAQGTGSCAPSPASQVEITVCTPEPVMLRNVHIDTRFATSNCNPDLYGIFVGAGAKLTAKQDQILGPSNTLGGNCGGVAVQVGTDREPEQAGEASLIEDTISDYKKAGIVAAGLGSRVAVTKSTVTGGGRDAGSEQIGIEIHAGATGSVRRSTINESGRLGRSRGYGIVIDHATPPIRIAYNTIENDGNGMRFATGATVQPSAPEINITHNRFLNNDSQGLILEQGKAQINNDTIEGGAYGIVIVQNNSQLFAPNSLASNDTIAAMSGAAIFVSSDGAPGDPPGDFLIKHSSISNNVREVEDLSTTFTVTRLHDS